MIYKLNYLNRVSRKIAQEIQRTDCQSNKYFVS